MEYRLMHLRIDFRSKSNANLGRSYSEKVLKDATYLGYTKM